MGFLGDSMKRLQEMAEQGDPNARQAQAMFGAFGAAFTKIADGAVAGMVQDQQRAERERANRAKFSRMAAVLGLSTNADGGLTWESRVKVLEFIADAINLRRKASLMWGDSISVSRWGDNGHVSNRRYEFTTASGILADNPKVGDDAAHAFRQFLDSVNIRYRERVARNIVELVKRDEGTTHVFTVTPGDVPYDWHRAGDIDLEEAVSRLLNALAPPSAREPVQRAEPYQDEPYQDEPYVPRDNVGEILASLRVEPDLPTPIGYKSTWYAAKASSSLEVIEKMALTIVGEANWETGMEAAHSRNDYVFVSPPVNGYVYAIGNLESNREQVAALGHSFPELMFFGTHRVVEYHSWAKCLGGELVRFYYYCGEKGEVESFGAATREEIGLGFDQFLQSAADSDEDSRRPNEEDVLIMAAAWGVDPSFADVDVEPGCGYLCQTQEN